jgi:hypothetical protein
MNELVEVRGFPPIRQKEGEWVGHGAFVESSPVHLRAYLASGSKHDQNESCNQIKNLEDRTWRCRVPLAKRGKNGRALIG